MVVIITDANGSLSLGSSPGRHGVNAPRSAIPYSVSRNWRSARRRDRRPTRGHYLNGSSNAWDGDALSASSFEAPDGATITA